MDFNQIYTFLHVCETLNFSRTAEDLFITQSTVTKRIHELEKEFDTLLFHRRTKQMSLTDDGSLFLDYAKRISELNASFQKELRTKKQYTKHLRIGSVNFVYECHLSSRINEFMTTHSHAIKITISHSKQLIQMIQDGLLDFAFVLTPYGGSDLFSIKFSTDPLVLVTSFRNTVHSNGIHKEELSALPYIMCNFSLKDTGSPIRNLFPSDHIFPFEIDNSNKIIPFLTTHDYYSFLPLTLVEKELDQNLLRQIPLMDFEAPFTQSYVIGKKNKQELCVEFLELFS